MANLLVTGGAGFIGGNFVHYWTQKHPDDAVIALDALTYAGNRSTLEGAERVELIEDDIRNQELVERLLRERDLHTMRLLDAAVQSRPVRVDPEPVTA